MGQAIIFGAGGQTGRYLQQLLIAEGTTVCGASRQSSDRRTDIRDSTQVESLIRDLQPDSVFHLAANSTTSHDTLFENQATIMNGTLNVLEAVKRHAPQARVFITGSGLQFVNNGRPIDELAPFHASSPYAVSRIGSVYAARYYRSFGLRIFVGYLFNHESPLRPIRHVSQMVASAAAAIAAGKQTILEIGDLSVRKEWTFAGDIAAAIHTLVKQDQVQEAVIGSGQAFSIEQWVAECFGPLGMDWKSLVRTRPDFRAQYNVLVSNPATMRYLGWTPRVSFQELAQLMVRHAADVITGGTLAG